MMPEAGGEKQEQPLSMLPESFYISHIIIHWYVVNDKYHHLLWIAAVLV